MSNPAVQSYPFGMRGPQGEPQSSPGGMLTGLGQGDPQGSYAGQGGLGGLGMFNPYTSTLYGPGGMYGYTGTPLEMNPVAANQQPMTGLSSLFQSTGQ